jgi:hypothetical protein
MSTIIICPNPECGRKLRVPSGGIGKRLRCPTCGKRFIPPAETPAPDEEEPPKPAKRRSAKEEGIVRKPRPRPPGPEEQEEEELPPKPAKRRQAREEGIVREPSPRPPEEEEQEEKAPRKRKRKRRRRAAEDHDALHAQAGWRNVARGFLMCIISIWMGIGEFVLGIVGVLAIGGIGAAMLASGVGAPADAGVGEDGSGQVETAVATLAGMGVGLVLLFVLINLLSFGASILNLVGQFFCTAVPTDEGNIKILAIMTFGLSATAVLVTWVWQIIGLVSSGFQGSIWAALPMSGGGGWVGLIVDIMQFIADICWFRLLYGIALEAHNERLASQINLFLISCLGLAFGSCLLVPCSFLLAVKLIPGQPVIAVGVVMGLIVLVLVGLLAWYIVILYKVRGSVLKLLRRAERGGLKYE